MRFSISRSRLILTILLAVQVAWGLALIHQTTFQLGATKYSCLFDDAMISMAYARNLVEGRGLVWGRWGEPVEGFTHPLWTLLMVPIQIPSIPLAWRSLLFQLISFSCLPLMVISIKQLMISHFRGAKIGGWLPAALLAAFYYPLTTWTVLGMETGLQALINVLAIGLALDIVQAQKDRHVILFAVLGIAYLLRMDMALLALVVQSYVVVGGGLRGGRYRSWLIGAALFLGAAGVYSVFRWTYYHDVLPNTYYLKLTGLPLDVRLMRGWWSLQNFVGDHWALLLLTLAALPLAVRHGSRVLLPIAVLITFWMYAVYIGGDAWDATVRANRFMAFTVPLLFVLLNASWNALNARLSETRKMLPRLLGICTLLLAFFSSNGLSFAGTSRDRWREFGALAEPYGVGGNAIVLQRFLEFQQVVLPGALIATPWAGIPAYFGDYRLVDLLGYNNRRIARGPVQVQITKHNLGSFKPGHVKWDNRYILKEVRPDAFFLLWGIAPRKETAVMEGNGYVKHATFWVRADSPFLIDRQR